MQNIFPARELYNSNPCRDMWDSEQLSQVAASCSQGSQNSSSDMFSQPRMSQLKGFSSFDVWSQPTNSQQLPEAMPICFHQKIKEGIGSKKCRSYYCNKTMWPRDKPFSRFATGLIDEPVKYYMKYMTKPPLFSYESERQSQKKQKPQTANYKELIEIQKKKTAERDDRDVLDSFISLLKDYTKEVKTAMDSFKDSIDTTLASKAEQVATAASQSAALINKLKDDLLESFGCLRKDLKENEELKEVITKQNEKIAEQDSHIKMLQAQLEDCRTREMKSTEKREKYIEREDKLLQKLDEISSRQTSTKQVPVLSTVKNTNCNQIPEYLLKTNEACIPQNPLLMGFQQQFAWDNTEVPSSVRLHHMAPQTQLALHPSVQNTTAEALNTHMQGTNHRHVMPSLDYHYQPQPSMLPTSEADAVVPCVNIQCQSNMTLAAQHQPNAHPTAAIAPMRPVSTTEQQLLRQQDRNLSELVVSKGDAPALRPESEVVPVPEKHPQETNRAFTSPGIRGPSLTKSAWPKQSPIAAVHPQIRVKSEDEEEQKKAAGPPCAKRGRKEDPFDIFVFDLTSSSDEECYEVQKTKSPSIKPAPAKGILNTHRTRSKTMTYANEQKTTGNIAESDKMKSHQQSKSTTKKLLPKKLPSVKESVSQLPGKASPTSKQIATNDRNNKAYGYNSATITVTPKRSVKATVENGIPRSKVAQSVFQRSKTPFKRNLVAAKRKLCFDASELFDGLEDDTNIQQITESIRKHAQRKGTAKVL